MQGLTLKEVETRKQNGQVNKVTEKNSQTVASIIFKNVFTYFNGIFTLIAVLLILAGSYRSLTFLPVILANTIIGIIQQIRSKRILDKLSLLDKTSYTVIREGKECESNIDELVLGDVVKVDAGKQIPADGYVVEGKAFVNESLLTGEADEIEKVEQSELKSGSFVVSGSCFMALTRVGDDSYVAQIMKKAKETKEKQSQMIHAIEKIILIAGILVIPIGILLYMQAIGNGNTFSQAIVSMVAAVLGMIPEGMYLLTTVALAISAANLAMNQVLLHDMRSIETLARVDVLCVDKTGTITNENMSVVEIFSAFNRNNEEDKTLLSQYVHTIEDSNITMEALKSYLKGTEKLKATSIQEFSSKTKYSCIQVNDVEYRLGAPEFLLDEKNLKENQDLINQRANKGQRVLAFVKIKNDQCTPLLFICLENEIRENAEEIFKYFYSREVNIKVISGDNPLTVSRVAQRAGIQNAEYYVDANTLETDEQIQNAVSNYTVFGRVKPDQKKKIVEALKQKNLKVAMTGDGVNDILAMKEADCSIAMGSGSSAAREVAQVVLMDSDFSHLKQIVFEGRKDINNITRSASLFLYKNIFSLLLAIYSIIAVSKYPLEPSQISLVSMFNIGIPAFLLALENNESKQKDNFIKTTLLNALPAALTSFVTIVALKNFATLFNIPSDNIGTACTYLLSAVGFIILFGMCKPFKLYKTIVFVVCFIGFWLCAILFNELFAIQDISVQCIVLCSVFAIAEVTVMQWNWYIVTTIMKLFEKKKEL